MTRGSMEEVLRLETFVRVGHMSNPSTAVRSCTRRMMAMVIFEFKRWILNTENICHAMPLKQIIRHIMPVTLIICPIISPSSPL